MDTVVVINPMKSRRPTGIGIAGDAIVGMLPPGIGRSSTGFDRCFVAVNDGPWPNGARALFRLCLVQFVPIFFRKQRLLFATHHAPLWRTSRHAVIVYDTIPLQFPEQAPAQTTYYRKILPRILRCAQRVVTISDSVRSEFQRLDYPAMDQTTVIPAWSPAAETGKLPLDPRYGRSRHNLLMVGARYPHKNLDMVLAALERLNLGRSELNPIKLIVAGCRRDLWAKAWGGLEYFEQRGWVQVIERPSHSELANLYAGVLVLIYPSLAEGQGLPPLEAMVHGCPVICSDLKVMRETCGHAAWYVAPDDSAALAELVSALKCGSIAAEEVRKRALYAERLTAFGRAALMKRWQVFVEGWR